MFDKMNVAEMMSEIHVVYISICFYVDFYSVFLPFLLSRVHYIYTHRLLCEFFIFFLFVHTFRFLFVYILMYRVSLWNRTIRVCGSMCVYVLCFKFMPTFYTSNVYTLYAQNTHTRTHFWMHVCFYLIWKIN